MRLRMRIERNALPPIQTIWPVKDTSCTTAQLLQQINDVFPLEVDSWGYEDYALTLGGYDLLHYHVVKEALKDEDELVIKPLKWEDLKVRMLTGRNQISVDGRHLVDGVPFGRPALRTTRPEVRIPPRKKRRLSQGEEEINGNYALVDGTGHEEVTAPLMLADGSGEADEEEDSDLDDDPDFAELDNMSISSQGSWHSNASSTDTSAKTSSSEDDSSDDSSSESDTSDSSSESDDEEAWEGIANGEPALAASKTKKALPNGVATSKQKSPPETGAASNATQQPSATDDKEPIHSTGSQPVADFVGIPFEGKPVTQTRNARRRDAKRLKYMKSSGAVPQNTTLAQFRDYLNGGLDLDGETETNGEAEVNETNETVDASGEADAPETAANHARQAAETTQTRGETEPPKKKKKAKKVSFTPETGTGIEGQRQQLVDAINSGGIDVSSKDGTQDEEPPEELTSRDQAAAEQETTDATSMMPRSVSAASRRAKLDIAGSQRLLFGSLGVRVPKTQEEKDALQARLAKRAKRKAVREAGETQTNGDAEPTTATATTNGVQAAPEDEGSWRDKINLTAVECLDEDITLSEPPFPFHQRWDPQYNRRGKKRASSTYAENGGKKRKRGQQQPQDEAYDKYNTDGYGDALNYDEEDEDEYWEDGALLNGDEGGNDEDEDVSETLEDDFPAIPEDLTTLPLLTASNAKTNDIITFTELACDASTGWQPQMAARTAKILEPPSASSNIDLAYRIQLSTRDVKPPTYDEEGNRLYSKFEMPQEDGEDERVREVLWGGLGEVRVVRKAVEE